MPAFQSTRAISGAVTPTTSDDGALLRVTATATVTLTNSGWTVGRSAMGFAVTGAATLTFAAGSSVTVRNLAGDFVADTQYQNCVAVYTGADEWTVYGTEEPQLSDLQVVTAKIADLAVATDKLADGAVTTAKVADLAVTTGKLADGAVTLAKQANVTGPTALGRVTDTGPPQELTPEQMREAAQVAGPVFTPEQYGAVGDDVANDTTPVQSAVTAALAVGGEVWLGYAKTYRVTARIELGGGPLTIRGSGNTSVIRGDFASGVQSILRNDWATGSDDLRFIDFTIDRNGANSQHGVLLNGVNRFRAIGFRIVGINPAITAGGLAISGIGPPTRLPSTDVIVAQCQFEDTDNFGVQYGTVLGGVIADNTFRNCYREAIGVEPEPGQLARDIVIAGNSIMCDAVPIGGTPTGLLVITESSLGTLRNVSVTGNVLVSETATAGNVSPGITVIGDQIDGVAVVGNTVWGMNGPGIFIGNAGTTGRTSDVVVADNAVVNCNRGVNANQNGAGISLRKAARIVVTGNTVHGDEHTASVWFSDQAFDHLVAANMLQDTPQVGGVTGTTCAVWGNKANGSNVFSAGNAVFGNGQALTSFVLDSTTSQIDLVLRRSGVDRWHLRRDNSAESGSNAGSNLLIIARDDAGNNLGTFIDITRQTGRVRVGQDLEIDGALDHDGSTVGFFGTTPATRPTGVAVTAAGIHAALVTLGLITA